MTDGKPIDILRELVDLYAREEMLAFFDFTVPLEGRAPVSGLCRVSKPKSGSSSMQYLSLTFIVDTPDPQAHAATREAMTRVQGEALKAALPDITEVVPVPSMTVGPENYVAQADILIHTEPTQAFISELLVPTIARVAPLQVTEFVWWGDSAATAHAPAAPAEEKASLVDSVRKYLKQYLG